MRPPAGSIVLNPRASVKSSDKRFSTYGKTAITHCYGDIL
jgi:hypothetical protein